MKTIELNKTVGVVEVEPNVVKCDLTVVNFETYLTPYEKDDFGVWRLLSRKISNDTGWQFLSLHGEMTEEKAKTIMPSKVENGYGGSLALYYDFDEKHISYQTFAYDTALESYQSLIKSWYGEQVVELVILIKEG